MRKNFYKKIDFNEYATLYLIFFSKLEIDFTS